MEKKKFIAETDFEDEQFKNLIESLQSTVYEDTSDDFDQLLLSKLEALSTIRKPIMARIGDNFKNKYPHLRSFLRGMLGFSITEIRTLLNEYLVKINELRNTIFEFERIAYNLPQKMDYSEIELQVINEKINNLEMKIISLKEETSKLKLIKKLLTQGEIEKSVKYIKDTFLLKGESDYINQTSDLKKRGEEIKMKINELEEIIKLNFFN